MRRARVPSRRSLRHSIADLLRERVVAGEFGPGDRLPSEPELARELGVSRSSLRAAITLLEEDGLVWRRHGSGTYVTDRPPLRNDLSRNFGVSSMIESMGLEAGSVEESCGPEGAPAPVAAALGIDVGEQVSVLRRVRTAGGRRVVDVHRLVPGRRSSRRTRCATSADGSIYSALAARGMTVHHGVATITPNAATGTSPAAWACHGARCC